MAYSETETKTGQPETSTSSAQLGSTYTGSQPGTQLKQEAKETVGELKQEMLRLKEDAQHRGKALFEGQRRAAADEIGGMVEALRKTAHELDEEHRVSTANLVGRTADSLDRVAKTLRDQDFRTLVRQVEGYARQHPGIFFGGSIIAGLLLARFLKSSSESRGYGYTSRYSPSERRETESRYVF